ncbi:hypothetical protein E2C01_065006 [Portunus trituberculatus]|uniref:Uncharacterized protein n=1 Tax=Portunus trituberculatus TaxID=210409 RepID=A0A5B7HLV7_PORTR|nr:hypothetical protein [Portunus trituberculatus]
MRRGWIEASGQVPTGVTSAPHVREDDKSLPCGRTPEGLLSGLSLPHQHLPTFPGRRRVTRVCSCKLGKFGFAPMGERSKAADRWKG